MEITVNGEPHPWRAELTIVSVLADLDLTGQRIAVELNGNIIPRSQHATQTLAADDTLEIVQAIGGG